MNFQQYIEASDLEKIKDFLEHLGFITTSDETSPIRVYSKNGIIVLLK